MSFRFCIFCFSFYYVQTLQLESVLRNSVFVISSGGVGSDIILAPEDWHRNWSMHNGMFYYDGTALWILVGRLLNLYDNGMHCDYAESRITDVMRRGDVVSRLQALNALRLIDEEYCYRVACEYAFAECETDVIDWSDALLFGKDFESFCRHADNLRCSIEVDRGVRMPLDLSAPKKRKPVVSNENRMPLDDWLLKYADLKPVDGSSGIPQESQSVVSHSRRHYGFSPHGRKRYGF